MDPQHPSRAAQFAYGLVTLMLVVALVVFPIIVFAEYGQKLGGGEAIDAHFQVNPEEVSLPDGVSLRGWPGVSVLIQEPTNTQILLLAGMDVSVWALVAAVLWLLRRVARSVRAGDPFGAANVKRLRGLGYVLVVGSLGVAFLNMGLRYVLFSSLPPQPVDIGVSGIELPVAAWLGGLGAFVLAEVFAHGLRLREDSEGTV